MKKLSVKNQKNLFGILTVLMFVITGIAKYIPEIPNIKIVGICSAILCIIFLIFLIRVFEKMNSLNVPSSGSSLKEITITDGRVITVDSSDEICLFFGFRSGDVIAHKADNGDIIKAIVDGVGPDKDNQNYLWYHILSPTLKGRSCRYGGTKKNLRLEGFRIFRELMVLSNKKNETYVDNKKRPEVIISKTSLSKTDPFIIKERILGTKTFSTTGNFKSANEAAKLICCEII